MRFYEKYQRSLVKTITYRLLIILSTFIITYVITGRLDLTVAITVSANFINTVLYYLHERVWNSIHWGKSKR